MNIHTKFDLGDKGFMLIANKVAEVYVHSIEVHIASNYGREDITIKTKAGEPYVKYRVQLEHPKKVKDRSPYSGSEYDANDKTMHKTKADMARELGIT